MGGRQAVVGVVRQDRGGAAPAMVAEALLPPLIRPLGRAVSASIRKRDSVISSSGSRGRHRGGRGSDGLAVREALPEKLASAGMGVDDGTGIALLLLFRTGASPPSLLLPVVPIC